MKDKIVIDKNVWYAKETDYATEPTGNDWEPLKDKAELNPTEPRLASFAGLEDKRKEELGSGR